jgi:hypothetical protein
MEACSEQFGINCDDIGDEAGASQAVQMLRALKHKNVAAVKTFPEPRTGLSPIDICCSPPFREHSGEEEEEVPCRCGPNLSFLCPLIFSSRTK